jgi:small-conductance mechanosensitive channel
MASFAAQPEILEAPAATVYLDGIENDRLVFNALAYVESPRLAYVVRSRVLFDVLARMAQAGLEVSASSTVVLQGDENAAAPAPTRPQP